MNTQSDWPLVSVGITTYNNPRFLRRSLEAIITQTYTNLEIIISDDCSPNEETQRVTQEFAQRDSRIRLYRQEKNLTSIMNYRFVLGRASGEYFMWADDDDEWDESFIRKGVEFLEEHREYDSWFCSVCNIDSFSRITRRLGKYSRFTSTANKRRDLIAYLREPESMQKANLFHAIFRRRAIEAVLREFDLNERWGNDMCFVLAFLTRFRLYATDEFLMYKRYAQPDDDEQVVHPLSDANYDRYTFPIEHGFQFISEHYKAVKTTPYAPLVVLVMLSRVPLAFRNKWIASKGCVGVLKGVCRRILRKFGEI